MGDRGSGATTVVALPLSEGGSGWGGDGTDRWSLASERVKEGKGRELTEPKRGDGKRELAGRGKLGQQAETMEEREFSFYFSTDFSKPISNSI